jgi:hypothetical protein
MGAGMGTAIAQPTSWPYPDSPRPIAREAWLYAYAPIQGYQTMFNQAISKNSPTYAGGFNRFRHNAHVATPADRTVANPSNDTLNSWAWLDLRAEPIVLSLPDVPAPRYYVNQWFDLYTHNFANTGVRATGRGAGNYLFVGPNWKGDVPKNIKKVFRAETDFIGTLTRTELFGPDDVAAVQAIQAQYKLTPLSQFLGKPAPPAAPQVDWPLWDSHSAEGIGFIPYLNALLPFMPTIPSEKEARERFARIGIGPGKPFDPSKLDSKMRAAIDEGITEARRELKDKAVIMDDPKSLYGSRQQLGIDYIAIRNAGASVGIYGPNKDEAIFAVWQTAPNGRPLDGSKKWVIRFEPGQLPPVDLFWSLTMYESLGRALVDNPIKRYSIGDRTPGLKRGKDGSLELYLQTDNPGKDKESNWLPTPYANFYLVARMYGPKKPLLDGTWSQPSLTEVR